MDQIGNQLLEDLLTTPGIAGYEERIQSVVRKFAAGHADQVTTDLHGNVIASINPQAPFRLLIDAHCDQIGLLVSHIDDNGFVYVQSVGGWDSQQLIGQHVTIWNEREPVPGVISRKAIHLQKESERKQVTEVEEMWIDIGAANKSDAQSVIAVGDMVTLNLGFRKLRRNIIAGPCMDDRVGLWVALETLRRVKSAGPKCGLFVVSAVQEEIGLRGAKTAAFGVDPQVGIALEVTHATDCPGIDKRQLGDVKVGNGPVLFLGPNMNRKVMSRMIGVATASSISHQIVALAKPASNDSNVIQLSRAGVATGLMSIPNRYMHSGVEVVSLDDLDRAADILTGFVLSVSEADDFTPSL